MNPSLANSGNEASLRTSMAHQIFHCFQFEYLDEHGGYRHVPDWIMEGQAEWAGEAAGVSSNVGANWWAAYLTSPGTPLWQRTYDAVGFYEHLAETGTNPWSIFDAMLATSTDNIAAYKATGAVNDNFLDTWASGMTRIQNLTPAWYAHGRWTTTAKAAQHPEIVVNGSLVSVAIAAVANADWILGASDADITELSFEGHVRMYTNQEDTAEISVVDLCTQDHR